jgi:hypothetical protein
MKQKMKAELETEEDETEEELTQEKFESNQEKYKLELEKLEQKYGMLTAPDVIREAANENNPLHNWFDWNDNEASEKWRLHQARMLIATVRVKVMFEGSLKSYKKYLNVTVKDNGNSSRGYLSTVKIVNDTSLRNQVLKKAIQEAEYWKRSYEEYTELTDIFKGIDKTKEKLKTVNALG